MVSGRLLTVAGGCVVRGLACGEFPGQFAHVGRGQRQAAAYLLPMCYPNAKTADHHLGTGRFS